MQYPKSLSSVLSFNIFSSMDVIDLQNEEHVADYLISLHLFSLEISETLILIFLF